MKVEVAVLGSPSLILIVLTVSVDVKLHRLNTRGSDFSIRGGGTPNGKRDRKCDCITER